MSGDIVYEAMSAVGMSDSGLRAGEDMRALGSVLFPNGPHVQPQLELGPVAESMLWQCPAVSCTYGPGEFDHLAVVIDLPGFTTAGELAIWMFGQGFPDLLDSLARHGDVIPGDTPGVMVFDLPPHAQAKWNDFLDGCQARISSEKNEVVLGDDVYLYKLYPEAQKILSDPSTDPDLLAKFLRPSIDEELRLAAASNPSCRDEDLVESALRILGMRDGA